MFIKTLISGVLYKLYAVKRRSVRMVILFFVSKLEGGPMFSMTLRRIFRDYHHINVGLYTYGWFNPRQIAPFTDIGRYCSIASGVIISDINHPVEFKSTHPFFFNSIFNYVEKGLIQKNKLTIGNDVWLGCNAVILPGVANIGDGAVIGAGAVVTKDVPDFAIVVGNPGRIIKYRFSEETIARLKAEQWWNKDIEELQTTIPEFCCRYETQTDRWSV